MRQGQENASHSHGGLLALYHTDDLAAKLQFALHAIQHRGTWSAGFAISNGAAISALSGQGKVNDLFSKADFPSDLKLAIARVGMEPDNAWHHEPLQPIRVRASQGEFAVVCIGTLFNGPALRQALIQEGLIFRTSSDAELLAHLIQREDGRLFERIEKAVTMVQGSYAFLMMTKNTLYAYRSGDGLYPLFLAHLGDGAAISTETCAFGALDPVSVEPIRPGQMVIFGKDGLHKKQIALAKEHLCAMEAVYYSREDSMFQNHSVHHLRYESGRKMAEDESVEADVVIGVPDTASTAAMAMASALKLPYEIGLIKNRYESRFVVPDSTHDKVLSSSVRISAFSAAVKGKRVILVDDSLRKGDTAKGLCRMLKDAGAAEVHLRIVSPQILNSCPYGQNGIKETELACRLYDQGELESLFDADSIRFLSVSNFRSLFDRPVCMACFGCSAPLDSNRS